MSAAQELVQLTGSGLDTRAIRMELGLSQSQFARLVGYSPRAVQSCEQGWRQPGPDLEKSALLLLMSHRNGGRLKTLCCWDMIGCPPERREQCITYRSGQGHLCWFLSGTMCTSDESPGWEHKRSICMTCPVFRTLMGEKRPERTQ